MSGMPKDGSSHVPMTRHLIMSTRHGWKVFFFVTFLLFLRVLCWLFRPGPSNMTPVPPKGNSGRLFLPGPSRALVLHLFFVVVWLAYFFPLGEKRFWWQPAPLLCWEERWPALFWWGEGGEGKPPSKEEPTILSCCVSSSAREVDWVLGLRGSWRLALLADLFLTPPPLAEDAETRAEASNHF